MGGGFLASIDLLSDLQYLVETELANLGYPPPGGEGVDKVLLRYLNLCGRLPPVLRWTIKVSTDLQSRQLPKDLKNGMDLLVETARGGKGLRPHMSENIEHPDFRDLLFYDWGVFHFHLGTSKKPNGYMKRTDELLFAVADRPSATLYLLDIRTHADGFANQDLLRVIEGNWPEVLDKYTLVGDFGATAEPTDEDVRNLRNAGTNTIVRTKGGRSLAPMGGGMTTNKSSVSNRMQADGIKRELQRIENVIASKRPRLEGLYRKAFGLNWSELRFKLVSFGPVWRVVELATNETLFEHKYSPAEQD
jgi:hypothetical protein